MSVQGERLRRGWSQAELANRSGVARATISSVETGRVVPSVDAALALARALETSVELLFAPGRVAAWAAPVSDRFHAARIGGRIVGYPLEPLLAGPPCPDGRIEAGELIFDPAALDRTLVIATCDPAAALLRDALAERGVRLLALSRPSHEALRMLGEGLVHAAGIHLSTTDDRALNRSAIAGRAAALIGAASWDVGFAHAEPGAITLDALIRPDATWINRPLGSGARACLDRVLEAAPLERRPMDLGRVARDHRAVADLIASGFGEAGVTLRYTAAERSLGFLSVETALYELAVAEELLDDPRGRALVEVLRSGAYARGLGMLPGIAAERAGEVEHA